MYSLVQHFSTTSITIVCKIDRTPGGMLRVHGVSFPSKLKIVIVTPPDSLSNVTLANSYFDYAFVGAMHNAFLQVSSSFFVLKVNAISGRIFHSCFISNSSLIRKKNDCIRRRKRIFVKKEECP